MAITRLAETVGAANSTTTPYDVNVSAPASTPNGVCVIVLQHASAADQVTSVTYGTGAGAVPLTERRFVPITTEAGAVYLYWASGVIFPSGAQVVRLVKTVATANHRMAICPMTVAAGQQVSVDFDTQSVSTVSVANPSWAHNTVAAVTECYFGWISDLNAITGIAIGANWTSLATIVDEGNQQRVWGRRSMGSAGDALPAVTAPADGYAGASISFKEAPLAPTPKTLSDSGAAADTLRPAVAVPLGQSGAAGDALFRAPVANAFEGGSNGVAVTAGNSGGASGDPVTGTTVAAGGSLAYTTARAAHGTIAMRAAGPTSAGAVRGEWAFTDRAVGTLYSYVYVWVPSNPPSDAFLTTFRDSALGTAAGIVLRANGHIAVQNNGTVGAEGTVAIPLNTWVRLEVEAVAHPTTGQVTVRWFAGDSTSAGDAVTQSNINTLSSFGWVETGFAFVPAGMPTVDFDDLAFSNLAMPALPAAGETPKTFADSGVGAESLRVTAAVPLLQPAAATDLVQPVAAVALADSGTGSDQLRPAAQVPLADQAAAADSLQLPPQTKTLSDTATAADRLCHDGGPAGAPDCLLTEDNLTGPLPYLWDDPASPDAAWLIAVVPSLATDLRVSFPTPATAPGAGGPTEFQVLVRKQGSGPAPPDPTVSVQLWEAGAFVKELTSAAVSSSSGQLVTATLTPADLTDPSGAEVELRLHVIGDGSYHDSYDYY